MADDCLDKQYVDKGEIDDLLVNSADFVSTLIKVTTMVPCSCEELFYGLSITMAVIGRQHGLSDTQMLERLRPIIARVRPMSELGLIDDEEDEDEECFPTSPFPPGHA